MFAYGIFETEEEAVRAVEALTADSFPTSAIGAAMYSDGALQRLGVGQTSSMGRGAALGAAIGAGATALFGLGAGWLAAGPLFVTLEALLAGGALGSLTGAIAGLGSWRNVLDLPQDALEQGRIVVGVETGTRIDEARQILREAGGEYTASVALGAEHASTARSASGHIESSP